MAVALNVGPLVAPTSKADYVAGKAALPPKLFSHNDQQSYWQALAPEGASSGWAGRLTDLLLAGSATSGMAGVTAGGNTVLLAGRHSSGYRVGPQGSTAIDLLRHGLYGSEACTALLRDLIAAPRPHLMESELAAIALRSIATDARLRDALATVPPPPSFAGVDTPLAGSCASWPASSPRASRWARAAKCSSCPRTAMTTTPACATTIPPCCANWARRWRPSRRNWTGWGWPIR